MQHFTLTAHHGAYCSSRRKDDVEPTAQCSDTDRTVMHALANPPKNATNTITLSFGLLNIELAVHTGTETTRVSKKEFFNGDSTIPLGRAVIRKDGEFPAGSILAMFASTVIIR